MILISKTYRQFLVCSRKLYRNITVNRKAIIRILKLLGHHIQQIRKPKLTYKNIGLCFVYSAPISDLPPKLQDLHRTLHIKLYRNSLLNLVLKSEDCELAELIYNCELETIPYGVQNVR